MASPSGGVAEASIERTYPEKLNEIRKHV